MTKQIRFIESITSMDNDVLIPVDRIKFITFGMYEKGDYILKIISDDGDRSEHFQDEKKAIKRYEMIKSILGAK